MFVSRLLVGGFSPEIFQFPDGLSDSDLSFHFLGSLKIGVIEYHEIDSCRSQLQVHEQVSSIRPSISEDFVIWRNHHA